jgi:hypothetical protein
VVESTALIPQAPHPICWAECLGDCSEDPSREHILTESTIQGPELSVRGLPFLQGKTITLHKSQFKSNILCRKHNNGLSQVNQSGKDAFEALGNATSVSPRPKNKIDGTLVERWLLKTLINMEVVSNLSFRPPLEIVEMALGKRAFSPNAGLFFVGTADTDDLGEERVTYIQALDGSASPPTIAGGWFRLRRFRFMLSVCNLNPETVKEAKWCHHPRRFEFKDGNFLAFSWKC